MPTLTKIPQLAAVPQGKLSKLSGPAKEASFNVRNWNLEGLNSDNKGLKRPKPRLLDKNGNLTVPRSKRRGPKRQYPHLDVDEGRLSGSDGDEPNTE